MGNTDTIPNTPKHLTNDVTFNRLNNRLHLWYSEHGDKVEKIHSIDFHCQRVTP